MRGSDRLRFVVRQIGRRTGGAQPCGRIAHHAQEIGARRRQIAFRLDAVGARPGQAGLGLRNVGARDLADLEAVARGVELALQDLLVVDVEVEHRLVLQQIRIGRGGVEKHGLLGALQLRACLAGRGSRRGSSPPASGRRDRAAGGPTTSPSAASGSHRSLGWCRRCRSASGRGPCPLPPTASPSGASSTGRVARLHRGRAAGPGRPGAADWSGRWPRAFPRWSAPAPPRAPSARRERLPPRVRVVAFFWSPQPRVVQYVAIDGSTCRAHPSIPPSRLVAFANPFCRSQVTACIERPP